MSERLKRIEFKDSSQLSLEEIARVSGFLVTRTKQYRETQRAAIVGERDKKMGPVPDSNEEFQKRLAIGEKYDRRLSSVDESIWQSYYEIMGRMTPPSDRLSMITMGVGLLGIEPVFLEQHWHTDDLDDPGRDYTEFQYIVGDPETMGNPPLVEEIAGHFDFVTEGSAVSDGEIPRIETFGTVPQEVLREILPSPQPVSG